MQPQWRLRDWSLFFPSNQSLHKKKKISNPNSKISLATLNLAPSFMDLHLQVCDGGQVGVQAWLQHKHQNHLLICPHGLTFYFIVIWNAREWRFVFLITSRWSHVNPRAVKPARMRAHTQQMFCPAERTMLCCVCMSCDTWGETL